MEGQNTSVNLLRIWNVFKKSWILVVILSLIGGSGYYLYTRMTSKPVYRAEAVMYATKLNDNQYNSNNTNPNAISASDLSLRTLLLNDCIFLANSSIVVDDVNKELQEAGYGRISSTQITATAVESTRYFKVSVVTSSPEMSNKAVTELCTSLKMQVKKIINVDNIEKISQANASGPIVADPKRSGAIGAAIGIAIGMIIIVLISFSDRTIKNDDEFSALFPEIPIIGTIPEFDLQAERHNAKKQQKKRNAQKDNTKNEYDEGADK